MNCPRCSTELADESSFCNRCGSPIEAGSAGSVDLERPGVLTALAVLDFVGGGLGLVAAVVLAFVATSQKQPLPFVAAGLSCAVIGLLHVATGFGVLRLQGWGRMLQLVLAWLGLLGFPCGTAVSILVLIYLYKPGVKVLYSGKRPEELSPWESAQLVRLPQSAAGTVAIIALAVAFFTIPVVGIIAAIAIPSLLRARVSANEAGTIGDLRTVISAEAAYQSANAGFYDKLECLAGPSQCIPGYGGPAFLSYPWSNPKSGYRRTFHAGPAAEPRQARESHASPSSVQGYAYVAVPVSPNQTGVRGFCGDDTGIICYTLDGRAPAVTDGRCDLESCRALQ